MDRTRGYVIKDRLIGDQLIVAQDLLENKDFDVSGWYAEQRLRMLGLTERTNCQCAIGDAIAVVAKKLLIDGIASSYPCTNNGLDPTDRFWVQKAEDKTDQYLIIDVDLEVDTSLPKAWLEDPTFDLVGWYRQHLDQHELFEQRYYETHRESCLLVKPPNSDEKHTCCFSHELRGCPKTKESTEQPSANDLPSKSEPCKGAPEQEPFPVNKFNSEDFFETKEPTDDATWDDLPELQDITDDEDEEDSDEEDKVPSSKSRTFEEMLEEPESKTSAKDDVESVPLTEQIQMVLTKCQPFPGDGEPVDPTYCPGDQRFLIEKQGRGLICIYD
jgi:hypothetical protein